MAVRRGGATPSKVFRGAVPVKKIMRGTVEVWTATLPSIYPQSGSWGPVAIAANTSPRASHTITEAGEFTITHTFSGGSASLIRAYILGPTQAVGPLVASSGPATITSTQMLRPGDIIGFAAFANAPSGTASGSWSIVKN